MTNEHSASCIGYICTCDSCYRCEGIIKMLQAENARYREALEKIENDIECSCRHCVGCDQGSKMSLCAGEALKDNKNNKEEE